MKKIIIGISMLTAVSGQVLAGDPPTEGLLDINGTKLYFQKMGTGEPLLILHGGPGLDHSYFLPQLGKLADQYQLIFFDMRGCGKSSVDVDSTSMTMDQLVEDVEAVRKAFHLETMNLFGHSFGGLIAMRYAIKYPEHLKNLLLVNTTPATSRWRDSSFTLMQLRTNKIDQAAQAKLESTESFRQRQPIAMNKFYKLLFRNSFYEPRYADSLTMDLQDTYPATSRLMGGLYKDPSLKNYDLNKDLEKVKCRTLILTAEADIAPPSAAEDLRRHLKNSSYVFMEAAGHFPFIEQPANFREAIDKFMKGR